MLFINSASLMLARNWHETKINSKLINVPLATLIFAWLLWFYEEKQNAFHWPWLPALVLMRSWICLSSACKFVSAAVSTDSVFKIRPFSSTRRGHTMRSNLLDSFLTSPKFFLRRSTSMSRSISLNSRMNRCRSLCKSASVGLSGRFISLLSRERESSRELQNTV